LVFFCPFHETAGTVPQIKPRPLPSIFFPVHYSLIIISLVKFEAPAAVNISWYNDRLRGGRPTGTGTFSLPHSIQTVSYSKGTVALFLEKKWSGLEVDHSPPSSAKVKNGGVIPSLPSTRSWRGA
jgi:hypothetical protein